MTVQMIRLTASKMAEAFYEGNRTDAFRKRCEELGIHDAQHFAIYAIKGTKTGASQWIKAAKEALTTMLSDPATSEPDKQAIYDALLEAQNRKSNDIGILLN